MWRRSVVPVLLLAFLAVPIGELCASCCPEFEAAPTLEAAMPCCGDCGPEVANAKPPVPAIGAARVRLDRPLLAVTSINTLSFRESVGALPIFVSPSPPAASPPASSVLRL
jgi:hypothetical protein